MKGILLVGFGNMGSAIYKGLKASVPETMLYVAEKHLESSALVLNKTKDVNEFLEKVDTIIVAVKPQSFDELCASFSERVKDKLIISVMAGVSVKTIQEKLKVKKVIRTMPNLNIKVSRGLFGWIASSFVSDMEKELFKEMVCGFGEVVEVSKEEKIDLITALSGSGPAYFFYLTEILQEKALEFGFSKEEARKIAKSTFVGSALLLDSDTKEAKEWREAVTSKGGTTEAALNHLAKEGFNKIFKDAISQASNRAKELNN